MIQIAFGKACKIYREKTKLSQEKFALSIGMDRTYYSSVESGKRNISMYCLSVSLTSLSFFPKNIMVPRFQLSSPSLLQIS